MSEFSNYLRKFNAVKGGSWTHTRIGDKSLNIFGGTYNIPDDKYEEFMEMYFNWVFVAGNDEYMTEKQRDIGPIYIDLDFRYDTAITSRQHTKDHNIDIVMRYMDCVKELIDIDDTPIDVYIMEKDEVNCLENKTKDGIHILINLNMEVELRIELRKRVILNNLEDILNLPLTNDFQDVLDEGITKCFVNTQMIGSKKPAHQPYKVVQHLIVKLEGEYFEYEDKTKSFKLQEHLFNLSTRYADRPFFPAKKGELEKAKLNHNPQSTTKTEIKEAGTNNTTNVLPEVNSNDKILIKVINALPIDCINDYNIWIRLGIILLNENYSVEDWFEVSKRGGDVHDRSLERCNTHWKSFNINRNIKIKSASLWKLLKLKNPEQFWILMEQRSDFWNLITLINHNDIANYFYNINPDSYLWNENIGWYSLLSSNIWKHYDKSQPSGLKRHISDTMQNLTKDYKIVELNTYEKKAKAIPISEKNAQADLLEEHKNKMKIISKAYTMFGSSDFTNGVISYLPSYYEDEKLEEKMDMNRYIFAFENGLHDLKTCQFRDIKPDDFVSTTTGYCFPINDKKETIKNPAIRTELNNFMKGLFECDTTSKYLLYILASCLYGGNRFEEFYGFTGSGGNGKGVIADLLKMVFGNYYISVDNTLFTKPLERKDQPIPALVESRCKRMMMTTEPESDDKLQGGIIKKISGGDVIEARTLHSKHIVKYVPQFKVILQMNNIPKITKIDGGIQRRMRIINFPFKFVSQTKLDEEHDENMRLGDPDVKEIKCKSEAWRNEFIIMLTEIWEEIKDFKELPMPSTVNESTSNYMNDNNPLKCWLDQFFVKTKNTKDFIGSTDLKTYYMNDTGKDINDKSFKELMEFNGFKHKRNSDGAGFINIQRITK
jgi:P4 family phage/plasmid primase-like protien